MSNFEFSFLGDGKLGLHLTINPQKSLSIKDRRNVNPRINQIFQKHGLVLNGRELQSLMTSRQKGIEQINTVLGTLVPYKILGPDDREKLAIKLADILMNKSLEGQLSRTVPTLLQQNEQREQQLQEMFRQPTPSDTDRGVLPSLLKKVPVGISLKIHLPIEWL